MRFLSITTLIVLSIAFLSNINANTISVPNDYSSIQGAINASVNGDTVLVAPNTYYENIDFRGKNIVVTSLYGTTQDVSFIKNTIINGSNPVHPDTASCVLIISGEDSTAVLQGFTLTGGKGTKWLDEHGAGRYVEGGGILVTLSSPTIKNNIIVNNEAIRSPGGTESAGGGAIRCGDGSPHIIGNVIINNRGMYGGGIVLNYCSNSLIANNIIAHNKVYVAVAGRPTFGGGGIWIYESIPENNTVNIIENNTIIGNSSNTIGGGIRMWYANFIVRNNIVWSNFQEGEDQIDISNSTALVEYNNVENGISGTGNISSSPLFTNSSYYLSDDSPCIDAGDPDPLKNDPEDSNSPGSPLWPSKGTLRNDMGAYGGPLSHVFPAFSSSNLYIPSPEYDFGLILPGESSEIAVPIISTGAQPLTVDSCAIMIDKENITIQNSFPIIIDPVVSDIINISWTPQINMILADTLLVYHNDSYISNPYKVALKGNSFPNALITFNTKPFDYGDIDVNTARVDTILYVYNDGSAADSINTSLIYGRVSPDSAINFSPTVFEIGPHDSFAVTLSFYPPLIKRTAFDVYRPRLILDSKSSIDKKHFDKTMTFHLIGVNDIKDDNNKLLTYRLSQNYPNPFNPSTIINYSLKRKGNVKLIIYDISGRYIKTIINESQFAGEHSVTFNAEDFASGIYIYKLITDSFDQSRKMILIK